MKKVIPGGKPGKSGKKKLESKKDLLRLQRPQHACSGRKEMILPGEESGNWAGTPGKFEREAEAGPLGLGSPVNYPRNWGPASAWIITTVQSTISTY